MFCANCGAACAADGACPKCRPVSSHRNKWIWIVVPAVAVVIGGVVAAFFLLGGSSGGGDRSFAGTLAMMPRGEPFLFVSFDYQKVYKSRNLMPQILAGYLQHATFVPQDRIQRLTLYAVGTSLYAVFEGELDWRALQEEMAAKGYRKETHKSNVVCSAFAEAGARGEKLSVSAAHLGGRLVVAIGSGSVKDVIDARSSADRRTNVSDETLAKLLARVRDADVMCVMKGTEFKFQNVGARTDKVVVPGVKGYGFVADFDATGPVSKDEFALCESEEKAQAAAALVPVGKEAEWMEFDTVIEKAGVEGPFLVIHHKSGRRE